MAVGSGTVAAKVWRLLRAHSIFCQSLKGGYSGRLNSHACIHACMSHSAHLCRSPLQVDSGSHSRGAAALQTAAALSRPRPPHTHPWCSPSPMRNTCHTSPSAGCCCCHRCRTGSCMLVEGSRPTLYAGQAWLYYVVCLHPVSACRRALVHVCGAVPAF